MTQPAAEVALLSDEERGRADLYLFQARLLGGPPDAVLLETLRGLDRADAGTPLAESFRRLAMAARSTDLEAATDDYDRLFIGLGAGELLPYASYYRTGHLFERPLARLRQDLAELGLGGAEQASEPEDHVSALFEVMAMMIRGETPTAVDAASQRRFFEEHVESWMPLFFKELARTGGEGIYGAAGTLGLVFLEIEAEAVALER